MSTLSVRSVCVILVFVASLVDPPALLRVEPRDFYVAPDGAAAAAGTLEQPGALARLLSSDSPARPGDRVWLRGGTYRGTFESVVSGSAGAPITFRGYPGERAIIDTAPSAKPALTVLGAWTVFQGFEITNSDPKRRSDEAGPWPSDLQRGGGITSKGAGNRFINLIIHDMTEGIGLWSESRGSLAYGNIIFNNGWQGPDRSHGHGIYTQNESGAREIAENLLFNQFSHGIHAFGSEVAHLDYIVLRGNVAFNNGMIGKSGPERDILLGGGRRAIDPVVEENMTYGPSQVNVGYIAGCTNATIARNRFWAVGPLQLVDCAPVGQERPTDPSTAMPLLYPDNFFNASRPKETVVLVRPNRYEPGRAHVVIYNWSRRPTVSIDLSTVLADGDRFELLDVQNHAAPPVASGVYRPGEPLSVRVADLKAAAAIGDVSVPPRHTAPEFAVLLLRRPE
jgi:hypothetical protein